MHETTEKIPKRVMRICDISEITNPQSYCGEEFLSNLGDADSYKAPDVLELASDTDESQSPLANDKSPVRNHS